MMGQLNIIIFLGLLTLGHAAICPKGKISPGREIICYTSSSDIKTLENIICKCTTLIHQGHDIQTLTTTGFDSLRKSLKQINSVLQFVISINDAKGILKTSANARQEAVARIVNIFNEVDGIELNVTAGTKERLVNLVQGLKNELARKLIDKRIIVQLPTKSEQLAKQFDVKRLSKLVDLFTIPTHYLMDDNDQYKTFHPSRLMGLFDLINIDSLVDLIHGLGAAKRKILISLPASGYKFNLKSVKNNTVGDNTEEEIPDIINRRELCDTISRGNWTIERDEDLTAPYAFHDKTWIAFDDQISAKIKGKYVLLRDLAGLAINDVHNDMINNCSKTLTEYIYHSFIDNKRKSREAVLSSLQEDIYNMEATFPVNMKSSDFKISRIVDVNGKIHSIRENVKTEFMCSRQGYFVHPKSCNRFYRCVKFNQDVEKYSVFEFDCPAGLAFDETTEVCVWPGSLPEGSPCPGSPEIAPTGPRRFRCPGHGYFADPQNCRWFFACIDLGEHEMMAYEFQCPYGLVFDESKLVCQWPWLVPNCAGKNYEHKGGADGSESGGHGGYGDMNHGEHDESREYDKSNNAGHDGGSSHSGDNEPVSDGYDVYEGHDEKNKGGHSGYDNSGQDEYEDESSHSGHRDFAGSNKGQPDSEYPNASHEEPANDSHNGDDGHDDHPSDSEGFPEGGSSNDEQTGQSAVGGYDEKGQRGYDESSKGEYDPGSLYNGQTDDNANSHVTEQVDEMQNGQNEYSHSSYATSSYTTLSGHSVTSHQAHAPLDSTQDSTGGIYSSGYPGPPTVIFGSGGEQYTTTGQIYSATNAGQGYSTNGNDAKKIFNGSTASQFSSYGTSSSGLAITDENTSGIIDKGSFDFAKGSTINAGNKYYTNQATGDYSENITPKISSTHVSTGSTISSGNQYYSNQAGMSLFNDNREIPIKSTVAGGYETNEYHDNGGRGTIQYNNGVITHKYTEDDVKNHRTSFELPSRTETIDSNAFAADLGDVYTRGGFTKTGLTKTGITTAQLGGTGSYVSGTSTMRPINNPDYIGENAFGKANKQTVKINTQRPEVETYSYQNSNKFNGAISTESSSAYEDRNSPVFTQTPFFNIHVYNTPTVMPSVPITGSPDIINTYSYANPTSVQYQENTYKSSKSSSNSASTGQYSNPFFTTGRKYTTASPTVVPVNNTTTSLDNYKRTLFDAAVSTVKPYVNNNYKTSISSTLLPISIKSNDYDYNDNDGSINSAEIKSDHFSNVGLSLQQSKTSPPYSPITSAYPIQESDRNLYQRIIPSVSYQQSSIDEEDATKMLDQTYHQLNGNFGERINSGGALPKGSYQQMTVRPQIDQRTKIITPYEFGKNDRQTLSSTDSNMPSGYNYPEPNGEFTKFFSPATYSTVRPADAQTSPANSLIARNEVEKLMISNNNRGTVKYTLRNEYEESKSDGFLIKKLSDNVEMLNRDYTTPQPRITTYSGGSNKIYTTPRYEIEKSTDIEHMDGNMKIIVKYSDLHPILLGKLSAECACKADPFADFRGNKPLLIDSSKGKIDLRNYDESDIYVDLENNRETELQNYQDDITTRQLSTQSSKILTHKTPIIAVFNGVKSAKSQSRQPSPTYLPASTSCPPSLNYLPSTISSSLRVSASDIEASASHSSNTIKTRNGKSLRSSAINRSTTLDTSVNHINPNEIGVLEMSEGGEAKCARPGLFRHPKFCNKFYACHWNEWKKKFTLHIFNCPIHLIFDNRVSACNWPSKGPACQDDNILV